MSLHTVEQPLAVDEIEYGEMLYACAILAAGVVRDLREHLTNTVGGPMKHYETLMEQTIERALQRLTERAEEKGYDGVSGIRLSHPSIIDGGIEVIASGTGYRLRPPSSQGK